MSVKTKSVIAALLIIITLVACMPTTKGAPHADNFAFVFKDTPCGSVPMNILDTTSGTLTHTPLGDTTSITIVLHFTDDQLESIYQKAMSIGFFNYPSIFVIPDNQVVGYQSPSSSYEISMTNGTMTNSVTWKDDTMSKPDYKKANSLRELINLIDQIIQSYLENQELPEAKVGCT